MANVHDPKTRHEHDNWPDGDHDSQRPPSLISSSVSRPSSVLYTTSTTPLVSLSASVIPLPPLPHSSLLSSVPFPGGSASLAFPSSGSKLPDPMMFNPRHALMRSRRISLPANLVQTNYHSIVGGGAVGASVAAKNRRSVASISSFENLPEEPDDFLPAQEEQPQLGGGPGHRPRLSRRSASSTPATPSARLSLGPSSLGGTATISFKRQRESVHSPPVYSGAYQSFAPTGTGKTSPLSRAQSYKKDLEGRERGVKLTREEKAKRADRRWRIALELRETERTYVDVLQEIDREFYQPLLAAIPSADLASRRVRSPAVSTTTPPTGTDSLPPPILSRKEIGEIFSNFTDVLNLSKVFLATLDGAIPDRPSDPVAVGSPSEKGTPTVATSTTPDLSSSGDTIDSSGPGTPVETIEVLVSKTSGAAPETKKEKEREPSTKRPTPPPINLGKVLLPILPFLKSYSLFISNFAGALARLSALEAVAGDAGDGDDKGRWKKFCDERRRKAVGKGLSLSGLLLNIVQRVPRYRYLLDDMLRFTEKDHPDWKDLTASFDVVDQVANHLESQIHAHTNVLHILDLQRSFINLDAPLLAPGRRLLKSGLLRKLDRRGNDQVRTFFLFNDMLIHASGGEIFSTWGGVVGHGTEACDLPDKVGHRVSTASAAFPSAVQYRFHRRFALEDVTVVGLEESLDVGRKFGLEIRSPEKSFALYADSLEAKSHWLEAIREASSNLLSDRRTLQRDVDSDVAVRNRRVSLPASASPRMKRLSSPVPPLPLPHPSLALSHQLSVPPRLERISGSPSDERGSRLTDSPSPMSPDGGAKEYAFPRMPSSSAPLGPEREKDAVQVDEERSRRWSDLGPGLLLGADGEVTIECRVIENYSAPVWVPDSKAERCMKCQEGFGILRRRHHCRLCGSVVCWACSTKTFVIPSQDDAALDRLARACDSCYETVFGTSPDPSLHQQSTTSSLTPGDNVLGPHASGSHFFTGKRASFLASPAPLTPLGYPDTPPLGTPGIIGFVEMGGKEKVGAEAHLASLLGR